MTGISSVVAATARIQKRLLVISLEAFRFSGRTINRLIKDVKSTSRKKSPDLERGFEAGDAMIRGGGVRRALRARIKMLRVIVELRNHATFSFSFSVPNRQPSY